MVSHSYSSLLLYDESSHRQCLTEWDWYGPRKDYLQKQEQTGFGSWAFVCWALLHTHHRHFFISPLSTSVPLTPLKLLLSRSSASLLSNSVAILCPNLTCIVNNIYDIIALSSSVQRFCLAFVTPRSLFSFSCHWWFFSWSFLSPVLVDSWTLAFPEAHPWAIFSTFSSLPISSCLDSLCKLLLPVLWT